MKFRNEMFSRGFLATLAIAMASTPVSAEEITTQAPAPVVSKVTGLVDLRPSWNTNVGSQHTENTLELGYQFTPTQIVTLVQYFETNLYNPSAQAERGISSTMYDTYLRTRINKFWSDESTGLALSYQNRTFLPLSQASRDAGMVATFRNYITLSKKINDTLTLSFSELPIFAWYTRAGTANAANPVFENREYLIADINITDKLALSVPLMFHQTRYSNYAAGASNNNSWGYTVWTYPELDYNVTENFYLGLAYYSANLIKSDLSSFDISKGLRDGVTQLVLGATL